MHAGITQPIFTILIRLNPVIPAFIAGTRPTALAEERLPGTRQGQR